MNRAKIPTPGPVGALLALTLLAAATTTAQAQVPADPYNYSRTTAYTYDSKGRLQTETVEPDNLPSCVVTTHGHDAWGNRNTSTTANCAGAVPARQQFATRSSSTDYTANAGRFPQTATNALNQVASANWDARFGAKTGATDIAGLSASWQLDDFGRVTRETRPDGTSTITRYCYLAGRVSDTSSNSTGCAAGVPAEAPPDAVMYVHTEPRNTADAKMGAYSRVYTDRLGRTIRQASEGWDGANQIASLKGALIVQDTVYNAQGAVVLQTQPYYLATGASTTSAANDVGASRTDYDALGRPSTVYTADPNGLAGAQAFGGAGVSYGNYGTKTAAKVVYAYAGQTSTVTNDKGQTRTEEKNAIGLLVRITDPAGGQLAHQQDAFGNLAATKDALQNQITLKYDILGRKVELADPDAGRWQYDYDALGQLVWQQNANQRALGQATTMAYDKLGRMTSRIEPEGAGAWSYDKYADQSACNKGAGRLCEASFTRAGTSDTRRTKLYYDNLGRPASDVSTVSAGPRLAVAKSYDPTSGRLQTKTYPSGIKIQYGYTALGYPEKLQTHTPLQLGATALPAGSVLWQADTVNAWGKTEQQHWSNGVQGRSSYQAASGRPQSHSAGVGAASNVVNHSYGWDSLNNLTYRADHIGDNVAGAVSETFEYTDGLSRLTQYTVAAAGVPGGSRSVTLQYNALGMLLNKSDVGVYTYGASGAGAIRPHALQSLTAAGGATTAYQYDANGNLTSADGGKYRTIAYTSFNLPDAQSGIGGAPDGASGSARYTWLYDENHQRIKEVRTITGGAKAGTRTTWTLHRDNAGALGFEQEVNNPASPTADNPQATHNRHYLSFGGQTLGVLVTAGSLPAADPNSANPPTIASATLVKLEYWHKDHLGSLVATTDHQGTTTARYAYDPFGKRRYTNGSYDAFGAIVVDWSANPATAGTDRGYTEHEHLDDVGIIHMNGRLFDPMLGRFLQADRFVQAPTDLQNYNRYAYCLNNPMTCTDPTGFVAAATGAKTLPIDPFHGSADALARFQALSPEEFQSVITGYMATMGGSIGWGTIDGVAGGGSNFSESFVLTSAIAGSTGLDQETSRAIASQYLANGFVLVYASPTLGEAGATAGPALFLRAAIPTGSVAVAACSAAGCAGAMTQPDLTVRLWNAVTQTWDQVRDTASYILKSDSVLLARNMVQETELDREPGQHAHHIVAANDPRAEPARAVLNNVGISINSAFNGVFLDPSQHARIHTNVYYDTVNRALSGASSYVDAAARLTAIGGAIQTGKFPF